MRNEKYAPGWPGIQATWTSSAKSGVGTALNDSSRVWFTISHGILNEIYYPRVDQACTRDLEFIITNGKDFFSEEKRDTKSSIKYISDGVPAYQIVNESLNKKYKIIKEIIADPQRDCILQKIKFISYDKDSYHLYFLASPHLANRGSENTGWVGYFKGTKMLFAERDSTGLVVASSIPWKNASVGFVGLQDGWHHLKENKLLTCCYQRAENGNIFLLGEIQVPIGGKIEFTIAIGFGQTWSEAAQRATASLFDGFKCAIKLYINEWENWHKAIGLSAAHRSCKNKLLRISSSIIKIHEAKRFRGGIIASLSIPWGSSKGDDDLGGYHLVWPRDLVEAAGGLLAVKANEDVIRIINYLATTQEADGHWPQNMWLDGSVYWSGIQMDETAFPILLVDLARRNGALKKENLEKFWQMIFKASSFIVQNGPVTMQDRWEEDSGFSPFTLAVEIAALIVAADLAELNKENKIAKYLRETADYWNDNIERWTYVKNSDLAKEAKVEGYYVRIAPPEVSESSSPVSGFVSIKNRPPGKDVEETIHIISPDALALVRFGLRSPKNSKILNTIKVIDKFLKVETPVGPSWHRYNDDGYGEHNDGRPFNGIGKGRVWPLLNAERAHYEIAANNLTKAKSLFKTVGNFANEGGMIPEQIWDSSDIPQKELYFGKPTGSAMPLVWAHAEYLKLCRSIKEMRVFDTPPQTVNRYLKNKISSSFSIWKFNNKFSSMPAGKILRIETLVKAKIHWSKNNWETVIDTITEYSELGIYYADLHVSKMQKGGRILFTFYWLEAKRWENINFSVEIK